MVDLPGDRIGIPYGAFSVPHKHPPLGHGEGVAWAAWPRGRLAGLVCDDDAEFWTPPLRVHGHSLRLNARTQSGGSVRVEVQDEDWTPRQGYGLEQATPISGDHLDAPVAWGAATRVSAADHRPSCSGSGYTAPPSLASRFSPNPYTRTTPPGPMLRTRRFHVKPSGWNL